MLFELNLLTQWFDRNSHFYIKIQSTEKKVVKTLWLKQQPQFWNLFSETKKFTTYGKNNIVILTNNLHLFYFAGQYEEITSSDDTSGGPMKLKW